MVGPSSSTKDCNAFIASHRLSIPHRDGGIRGIQFPLIADKTMAIAKDYGVLNDEEGIAYRYVSKRVPSARLVDASIPSALFIIDDKGIVRQITINDRPVGRCVPETYRLVKEIQQADQMSACASAGDFSAGSDELTIDAPYVCDHLAPPLHSPKHRRFQCSEKNLLHDLTE